MTGHQAEGLQAVDPSGEAESLMLYRREKLLNVDNRVSVPQTDTGSQGEKPEVRE